MSRLCVMNMLACLLHKGQKSDEDVMLLCAGYFTSLLYLRDAAVSQRWICPGSCTSYHTEIKSCRSNFYSNNNNNRIQRRYSRLFTISSQRRKPSPTRTLKWPGHNRVQITCNTLSVYHVQVSCYVPLSTKG